MRRQIRGNRESPILAPKKVIHERELGGVIADKYRHFALSVITIKQNAIHAVGSHPQILAVLMALEPVLSYMRADEIIRHSIDVASAHGAGGSHAQNSVGENWPSVDK